MLALNNGTSGSISSYWVAPPHRNIQAAFENPLTERLKIYYDRIREFCGAGEYRRYGKYLVKESFEGDATLTQLLTEYIERTAMLKY